MDKPALAGSDQEIGFNRKNYNDANVQDDNFSTCDNIREKQLSTTRGAMAVMKQSLRNMALRVFLMVVVIGFPVFAQYNPTPKSPNPNEPSQLMPPSVPQKGGQMFTTSGAVRAIAVFVQFADDSLSPAAAHWPVATGPVFLHDALDSTLTQQSENGNLTHYFRTMSFNQLQIFGDGFWVTTGHSKQYYLDKKQTFSEINQEVLKTLDSQIDFAKYDNWTFSNNRHTNEPDGVVDLIMIVYRESFYGTFNLHNGISVLFYGRDDVAVDDGKRRIRRGFPGSGFTLDGGINGFRADRAGHELGHKFIGSGHPRYHKDPPGVKNYAFWGILHSRSGMVNAYNRAWLGWSDLPEITANEAIVTLADYLTTGDAVRIPIPGTRDESFILENHQCLSRFDEPNKFGEAKGLYIYHVKGNGPQPAYDIESADGRFDWDNPYWIQNPWGLRATDSIPVFSRLAPNPAGQDALDALQTTKMDERTRRPIFFKHFAEDSAGTAITTRRVYGNPADAFRMEGNRIFAPNTNPNSNLWDDRTPSGITVELISETKINNATVYTVRISRNTE